MESQRTTRTKDVGAIVKGSHQLKSLYEAKVEEGKIVVGKEAEADAAVDPMDRYSMEWTSEASKNASAQEICNRWALKKTPTSPRSAQRPTKKNGDE